MLRILLVSIAVVFIDQLTKLLVKASFDLGESIRLLGNVLRFTYIENPGMAFGLRFAGPWFFTIFSAIASLALVFYLYKVRHERFLTRLSLALVLGGAIGNLIDRVLYSQVIDFIDVGIGNTRWPVFNIADSAVSVGMVLLIALLIFEKEEGQVDDSTLPVKNKELPESEERDIWQNPD